jgi:hypothetical protein
MSVSEWTGKVFRLRRLPSRISSPSEAAHLLSHALDITAEDIIVYSLAKSSEKWEQPASKVATLGLRTLPECIRNSAGREEWEVPVPGEARAHKLILDTHFEGLTVLNDVDPRNHQVEYVPSYISM